MSDKEKFNKKVNLSAVVEEKLRQRILNLEYPNNSILGEEALCNEFGVSRSPIREALRLLEASGMIHKMSNRSYAVKQISQGGVKELYELRLALEKFVVEKLCSQDASEELAQLLIFWQNIEMNEGVDLANADREFHENLAKIYGNKAILEELKQINERLRVFRVVDFAKPNRLDSTKSQHIDLIKAINNKQTKKALEYIEINVNEGLENAINAVRQAILKAYER